MSLIGFIERELGVSIPDEDVLIENFMSVLAIDEYLEKLASRDLPAAPESSEAVTASPETKKHEKSVFLIPGLGGHGIVFHDLANRLNNQVNVYRLLAPGANRRLQPINSLVELAKFYVTEIKKTQPCGPYHLIGYSFGGLVAFEISQQLTRSGEDVALLAAIDTAPPMSLHHLNPVHRSYRIARYHILNQMQRAVRLVRAFSDSGRNGQAEPHFEMLGRGYAILVAMPEKTHESDISLSLERTIEAHKDATRSYRPDYYQGRMVLIWSKIQHRRLTAARWYSLYQWTEWVGDLTVETVSGTHLDMVKEPNVTAVASLIMERLNSKK